MRNSTALLDTQKIKADLDPATADVDENMMRQVFYNLMSNALKAMPDGGTLEVTLRSTGDRVRISFIDSGMGMSDAQLDDLYVPFSSSFRTGTGLGLSIVYQIVSRHDGTIHVESKEGQGSTFTVELPRFRRAEPESRASLETGDEQFV
jgi:signal transduction histidine kinase